MKHKRTAGWNPGAAWLLLFFAVLSACGPAPVAPEMPPSMEEVHEAVETGIALPPLVRENLGITFATVERRVVTDTRRLPGQFELTPEGRQEYRALLAGRLTLSARQFEQVEPGTLLFSIDSPRWRQMQHEVVEAEGEIAMAEAALAVARARLAEARVMLTQQEARIENLASANVRKAELEAETNALRNSIPRLAAETRGQEAALHEAHEHYQSRLKILSSITGMTVGELQQDEGDGSAWRTLSALEVRAQQAGTVETLPVANGGWVDEGDLALTTIDSTAIRFHARVPQADIALLRDGMPASIVPPLGGAVRMNEDMPATIALGLSVNEADRSLSVYATPESLTQWARAGVGGFLEVGLTGDVTERLAIPVAAVIQDGLEHVYYRRSPRNPDRVLRVVGDLGESDGRWVAVRSGVMEGDQVVLDGVYALTLTGESRQAPPGYHFHADGSLHREH